MIKQHFRKLKKYNVAPPTKAKITPKVNITGAPELTDILNQPVNNDNDGSTTIAVQQVNTIQTTYAPMPIPMATRSLPNPLKPITLSSIWGLD